MNKHKMKHLRNSDTKTANRDHIRTTALERSVMNYWGLKLVLRAMKDDIYADNIIQERIALKVRLS